MDTEASCRRKDDGNFYAKLLLFGEYSIIFGSMALSLPLKHFSATLVFPGSGDLSGEEAVNSNRVLSAYSEWLAGRPGAETLIDIDTFRKEINDGIYLRSSIPREYGVGSSGALCAAVYDRYKLPSACHGPDHSSAELYALRQVFAGMESWFHGTSSGLDPLISYLQQPVLCATEGMSLARFTRDPGITVFLADTGKAGNTAPLVRLFMEKCRDRRFMDQVNNVMTPGVNDCIGSFLRGSKPAFLAAIEKLSGFQFRYLKPMIPSRFLDTWEKGLVSGDYFLKFCGSGGGGYLIGFTPDIEKVADLPCTVIRFPVPVTVE